ncbi:MAG: hypothetical protein HBSAPP04_01130 [Ignavibacteriaceae bacterium]|nr:MAG: hypothetical protein HBSAPP04_01130 [Ignavibacteriaceae bacterium]
MVMLYYNIMGIEQHKLWFACGDGDRERHPRRNKKVVFENYPTADISAYGNDWASEDTSEFRIELVGDVTVQWKKNTSQVIEWIRKGELAWRQKGQYILPF